MFLYHFFRMARVASSQMFFLPREISVKNRVMPTGPKNAAPANLAAVAMARVGSRTNCGLARVPPRAKGCESSLREKLI